MGREAAQENARGSARGATSKPARRAAPWSRAPPLACVDRGVRVCDTCLEPGFLIFNGLFMVVIAIQALLGTIAA